MAEVRPLTFLDNIQNFTAYLGQILPTLTIDNLPADVAAWYWGLPKWLSLLGETILMAYLGTLFGGIAAFALFPRLGQPRAVPGHPLLRPAAFSKCAARCPRWCSR